MKSSAALPKSETGVDRVLFNQFNHYWKISAFYGGIPGNADLDRLNALADLYIRLGEPARAETIWRKVATAHPSSTFFHEVAAAERRLAELCRKQGRLAEAQELSRRGEADEARGRAASLRASSLDFPRE